MFAVIGIGRIGVGNVCLHPPMHGYTHNHLNISPNLNTCLNGY